MMKRLVILIRNRLMIGFLFLIADNSVIWKIRKVSSIVNPLMEGPRNSGGVSERRGAHPRQRRPPVTLDASGHSCAEK